MPHPFRRTKSGQNEADAGCSPVMSACLDLVEAFGKAGCVLLPVEPTPEMLEAAAKVHPLDPEELQRVYKAMVEAA